MAFCNQCSNGFGQRSMGNPFQMGPMGSAMNSPFGFPSGGGNPMMQMMQMMMGMLMGMMASQMLQQMMAQGGGQPFGQFAPGMSPNFGGMPGMGGGMPGMGGPGMGNFLGNGGCAHRFILRSSQVRLRRGFPGQVDSFYRLLPSS